MKLAINCDYGFILFNSKTFITIDGVLKCTVRNGDVHLIEIPSGEHEIKIRCTFRKKKCVIPNADFINVCIGWNRLTGSLIMDIQPVSSEDKLYSNP